MRPYLDAGPAGRGTALPDLWQFKLGIGTEEIVLSTESGLGATQEPFSWKLRYGGTVELCLDSVVSNEFPGLSVQCLRVESRGFAGIVRIGSGIAYGPVSPSHEEIPWRLVAETQSTVRTEDDAPYHRRDGVEESRSCHAAVCLSLSGDRLTAAFELSCGQQNLVSRYRRGTEYLGFDCTLHLDYHQSFAVERRTLIELEKNGGGDLSLAEAGSRASSLLAKLLFDPRQGFENPRSRG
jgi:hypothetical protein